MQIIYARVVVHLKFISFSVKKMFTTSLVSFLGISSLFPSLSPGHLDYSMSAPTPWMVPFPMMDPAAMQQHAMAMIQSQQLAQQMALFQQHQQQRQLRLMQEYQQATPPPPVGPHNPPYPMELPPPVMPYLPPVPPQPVPAHSVPAHPEAKVPMVPMGAEGFPEQGGLFIPGVNLDHQRFYHSQGVAPKHSQAIPIVPPAEQPL